MAESNLLQFDGLSAEELQAALVELCNAGLLTCTTGTPGSEGALYAFAWLPLNNPGSSAEEVLQRHAENMRQLGLEPEDLPETLS